MPNILIQNNIIKNIKITIKRTILLKKNYSITKKIIFGVK